MPGKAKRAPFAAADLRGLKYFKPIRRLLEGLRPVAAHPNRDLHFDHYMSLLLLYFFSPLIQSLRDIQRTSDFKAVARKLGVRRASLGSLSEASHVFDPEPLKAIFAELAAHAGLECAVPRPDDLPEDIVACIAQDGTLLDALPKMLWAHWLGENDKAVKVHLQYDIFRGVPIAASLTDGNGDERAELQKKLKAGHLYVVDRGYMDYGLYAEILREGAHLLARLRGNFAHEVTATRELSDAAREAGVRSDQLAWVGDEKSRSRMDKPLRVLKVHVVNPLWTGRKPRAPHVNAKCKSVRTTETEFDMWLMTDREDISAESLALLYKYRWQIEVFFRWLKCTLGCRHLLAHSENGIELQMYAALIASVLIVLWTKRKPTKVSLFYIGMYLSGWCARDELLAHIKKLKTVE